MFLGSTGPSNHTSNMPVYIDRTSGSTTHNRDGPKQDDSSNYVRCDNFAGEGGGNKCLHLEVLKSLQTCF